MTTTVTKTNYVRFSDIEDEEAFAELPSPNMGSVPAIMQPTVKKIKKYSKTLLICISFFLLTLFLSITIAYGTSNNHGLGTLSVINRKTDDLSKPTSNFTGLLMYGNVTNIDTRGFSLKIHFSIFPKGDLMDPRDDLNRTPRGVVSFFLNFFLFSTKKIKLYRST